MFFIYEILDLGCKDNDFPNYSFSNHFHRGNNRVKINTLVARKALFRFMDEIEVYVIISTRVACCSD